MSTLKVGWIGLGDQGGPMARAIGESAHELHVWARRPVSLAVLDGVDYVGHDSATELGAAVDVIGLCVREDADITSLLDDGLLASLGVGTVLVNHGTGLPKFAVDLAARAAQVSVKVLDAPVSGGHPAAIAKTLTVMVGGDADAVQLYRPVFDTFAAKVVHMGSAGSGQIAKLINNTLLMMNQKSTLDMLRLAHELGLAIPPLVDVLLSGTARSGALQNLTNGVTPEVAEHLRDLQLIDMDLYSEAMRSLGQADDEITARAVAGAKGLPESADLVAARR